MLKQVWSVVEKVSAWPGLIIVRDCNGLCLALGGVTVGYLRWDGRLSLPFGADISQRLLEEEMVQRDPDHPKSTRVIFDVRNLTDADRAVSLLRLAYLNLDMGGLPPNALPCGI